MQNPGAVLQLDNVIANTLTQKASRGSNLQDISSCREAGKRLIRGTKKDASDCWFKYHGRPMAVMTDPEGCFREKHFRERLASKNVRWDPQPGEAAWRIGVLHLTTHHLKSCLTTVQKHTTNFIGDKGSHPFNGSSEVHTWIATGR